jgi:hypothetical protein
MTFRPEETGTQPGRRKPEEEDLQERSRTQLAIATWLPSLTSASLLSGLPIAQTQQEARGGGHPVNGDPTSQPPGHRWGSA